MAFSKNKKGKGGGSIAAKKKKVKRIIIGSGMALSMIYNIVTFSLMVLLPMSVIGGMVDAAKDAVDNVVTTTEDVIDDFALCASLVGLQNDEFFANIKAFFGNTLEQDARRDVELIIAYAGLDTEGDETSYGNTMKAATSVVYEFFIKEYTDILENFKPDSEGNYNPAQGSLAGDVYAYGQKFIDEHSSELPAEEPIVTTRTISEQQEVVDPVSGRKTTVTVQKTVQDTINVHVVKKVLLHSAGARVENEDGTVTVAETDETEFTNFFKPVFYTIAANALGTQNKSWGKETATVDDSGNETGDLVKADSFTTLLKLANKHSKDAFTVSVPTPPDKFVLEATETSEPVTNADGGTTCDRVITYSVEVVYEIQTKEGFVDRLLEDAYAEGEKNGGKPFNKETDKNPVMAQVDMLARFFGGELVEYEEGEGIESGEFSANDGWGSVFIDVPSAGPFSPAIENYLELFQNIDMTGCNEGATSVLNVLKNIKTYALNHQVRFVDSGCLKTIQDMIQAAGYARPGYAGPNMISQSVISHGTPPSSGYSILTKSPFGNAGRKYGHIGIYFKTTDGKEYIFDNEGGKIKVHEYKAWVSMYGNSVFGYTGFGYY